MCPPPRDAWSCTGAMQKLPARSSAAHGSCGSIRALDEGCNVSSVATDEGERMADSKQTRTSKTPAASGKPAEPVPASPPPTATPTEGPAAAEPHPSSSHRTPREIAKEEAGLGGPSTEPQARAPASPTEKTHSKEDEHIRAAVQRSAHPGKTQSAHRSGSDPSRHSRQR